MCGITGIITTKAGTIDENVSLIEDIIQSQHHRGPDYQKHIVIDKDDHCCILGHNRLSIIDLNEQSHQPMFDKSSGSWIVFNGEIYNYLELKQELLQQNISFNTQSDTEVLLHWMKLYGEAGINRLNGMFAFAWYNNVSGRLMLVRDRFGVKPLFYYYDQSILVFASSAKVIARRFGLRPNMQYVAKGLSQLSFEDDTSLTQYENLYCVESGCFAEVTPINGALEISTKRYYDLFRNVLESPFRNISEDEGRHTFEELFKSSVAIRLRADVPVAVSLSGGLDSTSVALYASKMHKDMVGYTFGSPDDHQSEGPLVKEFAKSAGVEVNYVYPNKAEIEHAFWRTIEAQDAPFGGPSIIAQNLVYEYAARDGIKVLLGGQGGDEAFMGYLKFKAFYLKSLYQDKKHLEMVKYLATLFPVLMAEFSSLSTLFQSAKRYNSSKGLGSQLRFPEYQKNNLLQQGSSEWLKSKQVTDVLASGLPTLLRFEDRNSMNHSIESRLPYMDFRMVEFGIAIPETLKLKKGYGKWINRDVFRNKLPDKINFARYKKGFNVDQYLYKKGLGSVVRNTLKENWAMAKQYFKDQNLNIDETYSDKNLETKFGSLGDVITALWLAKKNK